MSRLALRNQRYHSRWNQKTHPSRLLVSKLRKGSIQRHQTRQTFQTSARVIALIVQAAEDTCTGIVPASLHAAQQRMARRFARAVHVLQKLAIALCSRHTSGETCVMVGAGRAEVCPECSLR